MTMTHPLADLAARIDGAAITPDHPDYDRARAAWNLVFTHRPAVVVEAASVDDVVAAVVYAAEQDLPVQIGEVDRIEIDDGDATDTRRRQVQ